LRFFSRTFGLKGIGYDINPVALWLGRWLNRRGKYKNIQLIRRNFLQADVSKCDYIYVYLFPGQMIDIEDWLWKSIKKGTIIISNSFVFVKHSPFKVINDTKGKERIRLYKR
jgi:hypothetical protein